MIISIIKAPKGHDMNNPVQGEAAARGTGNPTPNRAPLRGATSRECGTPYGVQREKEHSVTPSYATLTRGYSHHAPSGRQT
jgi:hypothetical protein